jgi:hypothetical protein
MVVFLRGGIIFVSYFTGLCVGAFLADPLR